MKPSTGITDFLVDHVLDLLLYVKLFQLHAVLKNIDSAQIYLFIFLKFWEMSLNPRKKKFINSG